MKKFALYDGFLSAEQKNDANPQLADLLFSVLSSKNKATSSCPEDHSSDREKQDRNDILSALNEAESAVEHREKSVNDERVNVNGRKTSQNKSYDNDSAFDSEDRTHSPTQANPALPKDRSEEKRKGGNDYFAPPPHYIP